MFENSGMHDNQGDLPSFSSPRTTSTILLLLHVAILELPDKVFRKSSTCVHIRNNVSEMFATEIFVVQN